MAAPYAARAIDVEFTRTDGGTFAGTGKNRVRLSGLRVSAVIDRPGLLSSAQLRVWGMTDSMMADLSTMGQVVMTAARNTVAIFAGDADTILTQVYVGVIGRAYADFRDLPAVAFECFSFTEIADQIAPAPAISHKGDTDAVVMLQVLAKQLNLAFVNNGVEGARLSSPNYPGSAIDQARAIADHVGINIVFDDGQMCIFPRGGSRAGTVPVISPATGLQGYPNYNQNGLDLRIAYNPQVQVGGLIKVESSIRAATGLWQIYKLTHHLDAQSPGGQWATELTVALAGTLALFH